MLVHAHQGGESVHHFGAQGLFHNAIPQFGSRGGAAARGPHRPQARSIPHKSRLSKIFFVNFEKQISQCEMKCAKSLMFDGDAGVAGVTLLFLLFLKKKNKDRGKPGIYPRKCRKCRASASKIDS